MRRSLAIALLLAVLSAAALPAESFFEPTNPFTLKNDPIELGMDAFAARLDAIRAEREPLGLVLSGGSARAFAHIGVLAALEEAGVRPDYIVANSMGAIVALLYAAGYAPADIEKLVAETDLAALFEPVIPLRGGLLDARKFKAAMRTLLGGDRDLADLPIPILIVTEDLKSRRPVHLASGDFGDVLIASFALPAFFQPVDLGDLRLSDGGVTNLVPVAAAAAYSKRVIAATALYDVELNLDNPLVILGRAIDIGKTRRAVAEMEEFRPVVIRCEVEDVSFMDFARSAMLVRRGKSSAAAAMGEVLALAGDERAAPLDPELRSRRSAEVAAFVKSRARLSTDARPTPEFAVLPQLRLLDEMEGGSPFLEDERFLGAAARVAVGRTEASLGGLYRFDPDFDNPAMASAALRLAPFDLGVLKTALYASGESGGAWELIADASFVSVLSDVPLPAIVPRLLAEGGMRATEEDAAWYADGGLGLRMRPAPDRGDRFAIRPSLDALWRADDLDNRGPAWNAELRAGYLGFLESRGRLAGRWTLEGPGTAVMEGDGYRGTLEKDAAAARQGTVAAVSNLELAVGSAEASFSFAELALFRSVELSAYLDTAYSGEGPASLSAASSAGLALAADLSFLGLSPVAFSAWGGVSLDGETWSAGLRVGRLFQ